MGRTLAQLGSVATGRLTGLAVAAFLLFTSPASAAFWDFREAPCDRTWRSGKVGRKPAEPCRVSVTVSPYHLAYPILLVSSELRIARKLGVSLDSGLGGYRGGLVSQLGLRLPLYPAGTFESGLQLGPFVRATQFHLPDADSIAPGESSSAHAALSPVYNDVEFARANGRDAVFAGVLLGGKLVVGGHRGDFTWLRRFTIQGGVLIGYHHLLGSSRHGPHPDASRTESGFLPTLYVDTGVSF